MLIIMKAANNNIIVKNKNAARNYHLTDKYQAGIVLEGWEVKGLRNGKVDVCLLYTSPSPRDRTRSRMPSSA